MKLQMDLKKMSYLTVAVRRRSPSMPKRLISPNTDPSPNVASTSFSSTDITCVEIKTQIHICMKLSFLTDIYYKRTKRYTSLFLGEIETCLSQTVFGLTLSSLIASFMCRKLKQYFLYDSFWTRSHRYSEELTNGYEIILIIQQARNI